jgi:acyl dehydratase
VAANAIWPIPALLAQMSNEVGASEWFLLDQRRIDDFAAVTDDDQFIHTNAERARETVFGGTIAHGFLTVSLLSAMARSAVPAIEGCTACLNYGFDKVRFLTPVRSGSRVRARFTLTSLSEREKGKWLMGLRVVIEIEGVEKPALVADWLTLSLT